MHAAAEPPVSRPPAARSALVSSRGWSLAEDLVAFGALCLALWLNLALGRIAAAQGALAHPSPDLLLRLLPLVDMRFFFVYGFGAFVAFATLVTVLRERDRAAYIAWSYALLIAVRSVFIVLTPMRLPPDALPIQGAVYDAIGKNLTFEHDLFFSAHTAIPYLGCLLFRDRWARAVSLGFSVLLASTVLLSRLHYSIDVFGAYFITYALYRAEMRWIQRPYAAWKRAAAAAR